MATYVLRIREVDRSFFEVIRSGEKTIETRAATNKFRKIKQGDMLKFTCGKDYLTKKIVKTHLFKDIDSLLGTLRLKKIMPWVSSPDKAKEIWQSFPNYEEKIKNYGIIAFELQ